MHRFLEILSRLQEHVIEARLPYEELQRAERLRGDLKKLWMSFEYDTVASRQERVYQRTKHDLVELERLVSGQRMLALSPTRASASKMFRQLHGIVDAMPALLDDDAPKRRPVHPPRGPIERGIGWTSKKTKKVRAPAKSKPKPPMTFKTARDHLLVHLGRAGWALSSALKIPWAESPDGKARFWFKAQAIYISYAPRHTIGEARSVFAKDYRFEPLDKFANGLIAYAKK